MIFEKLIELNDLQDKFCDVFSSNEVAVYVNVREAVSECDQHPYNESDLLNEVVGFFEELSGYLSGRSKSLDVETNLIELVHFHGLIDVTVSIPLEGSFDDPMVEFNVVRKEGSPLLPPDKVALYGNSIKPETWQGSISWMNLTRNMASMAKRLFNQGFDNLDDLEKTLYLHFYSRNFLVDEVKEALSRHAVDPSDPKPQHI